MAIPCLAPRSNTVYKDSIGNLAAINPLLYRGYVFDTGTGLYYLQSRYYNPEMGRFINADAFASTGQGLIGNNMFAYCNNNPICYTDITGMLPDSLPSLGDFYMIHKEVQYRIAEENGYAIEVYVNGSKGRGFLDIYDAEANEYYEVKSIYSAYSDKTHTQMEKYDASYIKDIRFIGYSIPDHPERGIKKFSGSFEYGIWSVDYFSLGDGLIAYTYKLNEKRVAAIATVALAAIAAGAGGWVGDKSMMKGALAFYARA